MEQRELPVLRSERLVLRPFGPADAPDVQRLAGEFAMADATIHIPHPYQDGVAAEWIATHRPRFAAGELCALAITGADNGGLMGAVALSLDARFNTGELGYWVGTPFWGCGYCTEASRAVLGYGFDVLGLNRVFAHHMVRNPASGRVMQKLGMTHEGRLRQHVRRWDRYEDVDVYGILAKEWNQPKEGRR